MTTPAGWYTDPADAKRNRWWDGTQWTEHYSEPYAAAGVLTAPAGTSVYNVWIWLVVFLPYLTLPFLFTIDFSALFSGLDYTDPSSSTRVQFELMTSPAFLALTLGGWVLCAAVIVCSWLDWRWLRAAGVPKPFHWAFGFFSLAGYPVYAIGRAVVTRRRTGKGLLVMWLTIAMLVVSFIVSIAWAVSIFAAIISQLPPTYY
jgi:hypothetical protein